MNTSGNHRYVILALVPLVLLLSSCTAGDPQFSEQSPAGFWWGIWHGIISVIALVVHVFNENVAVYEVHNTGGWYDFGFLLGVICIWGGGSHVNCKSAERKQRDKEWDEIGDKVEKKLMRKMKQWADEEDTDIRDEEWDEVSRKAEKKLKRIIREWAEKE